MLLKGSQIRFIVIFYEISWCKCVVTDGDFSCRWMSNVYLGRFSLLLFCLLELLIWRLIYNASVINQVTLRFVSVYVLSGPYSTKRGLHRMWSILIGTDLYTSYCLHFTSGTLPHFNPPCNCFCCGHTHIIY